MKRNIIAISLFILLIPCMTSTMEVEVEKMDVPYYEGKDASWPLNVCLGYAGCLNFNSKEWDLTVNSHLLAKIPGVYIGRNFNKYSTGVNDSDTFYDQLVNESSQSWFSKLPLVNFLFQASFNPTTSLSFLENNKRKMLMAIFEKKEKAFLIHLISTMKKGEYQSIFIEEGCEPMVFSPNSSSFNTLKVDQKKKSMMIMMKNLHKYFELEEIEDYLSQTNSSEELLKKATKEMIFEAVRKIEAKKEPGVFKCIDMAAIVVKFSPTGD